MSFLQLLMQEAERFKRNVKEAPARVKDQVSNYKEDWKGVSTSKLADKPMDAEKFKAAIEEVAGNAIPGGGSVAGMFIGPKAATWSAKNADLAKQAMAKGMNAKDINAILGVTQGADGLLRQEISDAGASVVRIPNTDRFKLVHPELDKAYPGLIDTLITNFKVRPGAKQSGSFSRALGTMDAVASSPQALLQVILHEAQHGVQAVEGFAKGGTPNIFKPGNKHFNQKAFDLLQSEQQVAQNAIDKAIAQYHKLPYDHPAKEIAKKQIVHKIEAYNTVTPMQLYKRLMGETEARATVNRQFMDKQERMRTLPEYSEDVPRAKQIYTDSTGTIEIRNK